MCGIAGYITNRNVDNEVLEKMVEALRHRGPDSKGEYHSLYYHAGMRRLSINDLITGDQPLYNKDKSVVLLYNGEIYNSPQLRKELEGKGYKFRTHSDGEVICHLYDEMGEGLFERLDGMFAVALWLEKEKRLILARDIPGEKPLYYSKLGNNEIVFASEIKSLALFPGIDLSLNYQGLWDFPTFTWIPQPDTIYKNVFSLPRSHILICGKKGIRLKYYANKFNLQYINMSDEAVIEETRRVVQESVKSRLLSDVPVGCFLSGGLDSSIVATIAAKALPSISTFTIGFEDVHDPYHGTADESKYSEEYAKKINTKHHTIRITSEDCQRDLLKFCSSADQPFSVPSGMGIMAIARAAHDAGIKVLLSGDCSDECFGGYSWYFYLDNNIPNKKMLSAIPNGGETVTFNNFGLGLKERLSVLNNYIPQKRAWAWHYYASEVEKEKLYSRDVFKNTKSSLRFFHEYKDSGDWAPEDFIKQDREFYLFNEMLQKLDRMTMAYSVEGRVPFAAPSVLAHAEKLKFNHMVRGNYLKWALRNAFKDILPREIYDRPKHGFNVPIDHWLKNGWSDLFEETFRTSSNLSKAGIITKDSRDVAYAMIHDRMRVNGPTIFSLIILNIWLGGHSWRS
ncbi:MAG: asparagine synthase (glutamine-hydrolyzing) [Candidatus Omnitrophica bacterium]|nr:asparagine synthase (glutamine-hydrolyzing) [Candidatus Omnitrophota bacterium]